MKDSLCFWFQTLFAHAVWVSLLLLVSGRGVSWWADELLANCFKHHGLFPPWRHLLGTWIIYLFIQQNGSIILAAQQHHTGKPRQPPYCVWKLISLFIPALTPKPTVTCWAVSLLPWDTLSHQWRRGHLLSPAAPAVAQDVRAATSKDNGKNIQMY